MIIFVFQLRIDRNNKNRRKNNNNNVVQNQKPKIENVNNNKNNRSPIIGFSSCGKTYLRESFLLQKQETIFLITKSLRQYPIIKAQLSD